MTGDDALRQALRSGAEALRHLPDPLREARLLLALALGVEAGRLDRLDASAVTDTAIATFERLVARRASGEPMSHIRGSRAFWTQEFIVTPDVLDPRPDTETLVDAALSGPVTRVLDLGTGSGCILLSILGERPEATGIGTDLSEAALAVAVRNAERLGLTDRVTLRQADWLAGVTGTFDLIVSNPPYISAAEMADLSPEVLHEPEMALTPGGDGLDAYRTIARDAPAYLTPGGRLLVEIGATQADAVCALFTAQGLIAIEVLRDLPGKDRVVSAQKAA